MDQLFAENMSRRVWGVILVSAGLIAVAGALVLESLGVSASSVRPLPFVGSVVAVKLALFALWPAMARKGKEASTMLELTRAPAPASARAKPSPRKGSVALWDDKDPRVDVALFSSNVPTFVLSHEQRFLDWNPAFHLVFGECEGIERGAHVSAWFALLENFKRVSKREEKLYGEGILPLADRERATFESPVFGRMVFSKIMSPIIDRRTGRVLGWTVVLNVNSVTRRAEFLERLHGGIARETKRIRYAAAVDGVLADFPPLRRLLKMHASALVRASFAGRVLDVGAGTGELTLALLQAGHRVTAVDRSTHQLRHLRDKTEAHADKRRIVRRDPNRLTGLPAERYDAATMMQVAHRLRDLPGALAAVHAALKPGGTLTLSAPLQGATVEGLFELVREHLVASGRYDELKHQLSQVLELELEAAISTPYRFLSRDALRAAVLEAGFFIEDERQGLVDGHTLFLVARK